MAKRRYSFDEAKIARFHKEKRGQGQGGEYHPWLTVHDVPSSGRRARIHWPTTGRKHHLLSDIETSVFFLLIWKDKVADIREQFPLDRDRTRAIAEQMGVEHPRDRHSRVDLVMTLDLLVDVTMGGKRLIVPFSAKPSSELDDLRTLEKLEIERRYCVETWGAWRLMTERDYSEQYVQNLRWIHEMHSLDMIEAPASGNWNDRCDRLLHALRSSPGKTIGAVFNGFEEKHGCRPGEALTAYRHLLAKKSIAMDLAEQFRIETPVANLKFANASVGAQRVA